MTGDKIAKNDPTTIKELVCEVSKTRKILDQATNDVHEANRNETIALNNYNSACKKLDEAMQQLRQQAPRGTEWSRASRP